MLYDSDLRAKVQPASSVIALYSVLRLKKHRLSDAYSCFILLHIDKAREPYVFEITSDIVSDTKIYEGNCFCALKGVMYDVVVKVLQKEIDLLHP